MRRTERGQLGARTRRPDVQEKMGETRAGRDIQSPSPEQGAKWKAKPKCIVGSAAILSVSVPPSHFPGDDDRLPIPEGTWSPVVFVTLGGHSVLWEPAKSIVFRAGLTIE